MATERFVWRTASKEEACLELRKRNVVRKITKDADILCVACGKKPKRGEFCYFPAFTVANTNKIIGHKEHVDRECQAFTAQSAAHAPADRHVRTVAHKKPAYQSNIAPSPIDEYMSLPYSEIIKRIESGLAKSKVSVETAEQAYERGCRDTAAKLALMLQERGIQI